MNSLHGKRVLITGASSGVGAAAAERFALAGCDVALMARSRDGLEVVAETVRKHGREALVLPADVADREALAEAVAEIADAFGGLDILVVNAAITIFGPFNEVEPDDFDRVMAVTFGGAVNITRIALPLLEASSGTIVSVGSLNSRMPLPTWSSYCAAKHAERGFFNTLAIELSVQGSGVQVTQLHPGAINTQVWSKTPSAVGHLPRRPPEGYPPEQVAEGLVTLARAPRREVLFGMEAIGLNGLWTLARPVGDQVLGVAYRYFLSGKRPAQSNFNALREAIGDGVPADGLFQRPSLTSAVRGLAGFASASFKLPR